MTTFNAGKPSPDKNEVKNASLAMKSRQQVLNEVNKRRTLLQDNSWIKTKPEEENAEENYGRVVLNQYKSQDGLHRDADEKGDQKALLSRYRSDTTLDRIPATSDADKGNKLQALESQSSKSNELEVSANTGNATSPVKKKRQSWMPPPVSSPKVAIQDVEQQKRVSTASNKSGGPKMTVYSSEPAASPKKSNATAHDRPAIRPKPSESTANKIATERAGRSPGLDDPIKGIASGNNSNKHEREHQDLDNLIKVNRTSNGPDKGGRDLANLTVVNKTVQKDKRGQELDDLVVIKSPTADENKKWQTEQSSDSGKIQGNQVEADNLHQVKKRSSCNASSNHSSPKDTIVYTRIYKNSQFLHDAYEDSIPGKSIKTVYSTSDRAIIEKEMCTYCRKPLGTDTKMILDALQICCHASCFKCEVCHKPLENLKAGDSIWIYRNTVHCTPCYTKVKASWVY